MLWDSHIHTSFSGDSEADPELMIRRAQDLGLSGICITDHLDYDYPKEPDLFLLPLDEYAACLPRLKQKYKSQITIGFGIEIGLQPHLARIHSQITASNTFDFVIASSHTAQGMDPYYCEYFSGISQEEAYIKYFSSILENLSCFSDFDVYGHLDYVTRYGNPPVPAYTYPSCQKLIDDILKKLISMEKGLEINTGGFSSACRQENPHGEILKRYYELGGRIITAGSDAHSPEEISRNFHRASELLRNCGFKEYCYFTKRSPVFLPL